MNSYKRNNINGKKLTNRILVWLIFLTAICGTACRKFLEVKPPNDKLETNTVFADSLSASSAITGIYSTLMQGNTGFIAYKSVLGGLSADEFVYPSASNKAILEYNDNDLNITNSMVNNLWTEFYATIYRANSVIEGVSNSDGIVPSAKTKLIAEAKFIRAFCYFYLVNYFGEVPLVTTTAYQANSSLPRSSVSSVYTQIINDLIEAKSNLYAGYPTSNRARPIKSAASALLSRVYLFTKDYVNAEKEATSIIDNTSFSLITNLDLVFKKESTEIIWQLAPTQPTIYNSYDGNMFIPSSNTSQPQFALRPSFVNDFNLNDKRKSSWVKSTTVGTDTYYFPYKYKAYAGGTNEEYEIVFRLAEQYLIRAEARCQQSKITGTNSAESDLNIIRSRAGLGNTGATDQQSMLAAIETEKRNEMFAEWGTRWLDLKRWPSNTSLGKTRADDILAPLKGVTWQSTDILWPIPVAQISLNGNLKQNPGY